jgi:transcriptional adapter 2-alpha
MGIRNLEQATQYEIDRKKRDIEQKSKKQRQSASYLFETGRSSTGGSDSASSSPRGFDKNNEKKSLSRSGRRNTSNGLDNIDDNDDKFNNGLLSLKDKKSSTTQSELADMTKAPQADLLTDKELSLCQQVPMLPSHYLAAKDCIVREAFRNGTLTNEGIKRIIKLDIPKTEKIYDFFVKEMPYITTKTHGNVGRKRKQNTDSENSQSQAHSQEE